MSNILDLGRELIRICPTDSTKIEYSTNGGRIWLLRCKAPLTGGFSSLVDNGGEIVALTPKGTYYSRNAGRTWLFRGR
jgi:hypothetical protein